MKQKKLYDVQEFRNQYDSIIRPVGQLVEIDPRIPDETIVNRFCSGFLFNSKGHFFTADHCLPSETFRKPCQLWNTQFILDYYRISFTYESGKREGHLYSIQNVLGRGTCYQFTHNGIDYAAFDLGVEVADRFGHIPPTLNPPQTGLEVIAVSHPNSKEKQISFGQVQYINRGIIDHTARIEPGSSGSPLISQSGHSSFFARGINIQVSVDPITRIQDHQHYYALSMSEINEEMPTFFGGYLSRFKAQESYGGYEENRLVVRNNDCCA